MKAHIQFLTAITLFLSGNLNAQVTPLLTTTWNQGCYYNADCPPTGSGGACGKVWTGCNATAIAQIFKYYNYPTTGMENHCNTNAPTNCVDFSIQTYNYAAMPNNVTSSNAEVAKLIYHLGIAVDMQWSGISSNSFFASIPMKKYFLYSPQMYSTATFMFNTTQELINGIKAELNAGRPVYAKGGNHFYLIDGYNLSDQFHMNFGWGGLYDGYYNITSVVNGAGTFTPTNFIFNIRPLAGSLETSTDTIDVPVNSGLSNIEFTSLNNWTMSSPTSWITLNQNNGAAGYYSPASVSFNYATNNGPIRYGYIFIDNGGEIDTIVVKQAPSPLVVNPDTLFFTNTGGSQDITIEWFSWSSWNVSSPDGWITVLQNSGTGNDTITVSVTTNPLTTPRIGYVIVTGGVYTDTVFVSQDATITTSLIDYDDINFIKVFPNPTNGIINLSSSLLSEIELVVFDVFGRNIIRKKTNEKYIDLSRFPSGVYIIEIIENNNVLIKEKIIKQ